MGEVWDLLRSTGTAWVDDPDSDVVWAGEYEGRWGVRMAQRARDFTTVWFEVGERTLGCEAYVLPAPRTGHEEVYRQALFRNQSSWPVHFSLDGDGDLYLRGRTPIDAVSVATLDQMLGAIYQQVELAFRGMVRAGFAREKSP